ncbi:MAG: hypothetical protein NW226_01110 [Microscillaceae bacterium]|nr:hypothetical protein [Microscillaceae bacterium]
MLKFKTTVFVKEENLSLNLPKEFEGKWVEITVKEIPEDQEENRKKLQEILLHAPTWTDEEYQEYLEAKAHFGEWNKLE